MKRSNFIGLLSIALVLVPAIALAGVALSPHDLSGGTGQVCMSCHIPHNANGARLWAGTPGAFTGVMALCATCHASGGIATIGNPVFEATKQNHKIVGGECSGTGACHDVHNGVLGGGNAFLDAAVPAEINGSRCVACHDATAFNAQAASHGDKTQGTNHFMNGSTFTCDQCHSVHGATPQTTNPSGLTNPILLADNDGTYWGQFCVSCHTGTAPAAGTTGSGGVAATDNFNYYSAVADGSDVKHPTDTTNITGCNTCHDPHQNGAGVNNQYILLANNADSAYCVSCHSGLTTVGEGAIGATTHPTGSGVPATPANYSGRSTALYWANQVDDDGAAGADWSTATANMMVCETCHSVHRKGVGTPFLRMANSNQNEICRSCHSAN